MTAISADDASDAVATHLRQTAGKADPQWRFRATSIPGTTMWSVTAYQDPEHARPAEDGRPGVMTAYVVGPDQRVWVFSGDPHIHDVDMAVKALARIYKKGLADHVDPDLFAERVHEITEQRRTLADILVADARSGSLKVHRRILP